MEFFLTQFVYPLVPNAIVGYGFYLLGERVASRRQATAGSIGSRNWRHYLFVFLGSAFILLCLNFAYVIIPGLFLNDVDENQVVGLMVVDALLPIGAIFAVLLTPFTDRAHSFVWGIISALGSAFYLYLMAAIHLFYYGGLASLYRMLHPA